MRRTWPLKVERFCCSDCSSPMSASTWAHQGSRGVPLQGRNRPARAISAASPTLLSVTVLPPVFGPVIATTRSSGPTRTSTGTTARPPSRFCCQSSSGWRSPCSCSGACGSWASSGRTAPSQAP